MTLHGQLRITRVRIFLSSLIMAMEESSMDAIMDCAIIFNSSRIIDPDKLSFSQGGVGIQKRHLGLIFFFQQQEVDLPTT